MSRHVVFVTQAFPPDKGGNASRIRDTAVHLAENGWEVTVLSPPPSYPSGEFERSWRPRSTERRDGVTVHRLWTWQPQREDPGMAHRLPYFLLFAIHAACWLLFARIAELLGSDRRGYDVVVTSTPPISTGAPGLVASLLGLRWVVDVRDLWIDAAGALGYIDPESTIARLSRRFQRLVLHTADRVAVTTPEIGRSLREHYGEALSSSIVVVPNGVETARFRPSPDDASDATGDGRPTIVYTGNLGSAQDLEAVIRAMARLDADATLRLVGSGDRESALRKLADDLELNGRVEFAGVVPREEIPEILAAAEVGVAPLDDSDAISYAMPTKVYEYMASGLPTVVTGGGAVEQFVERSGGGVHAPNDPDRIAERLDELLADDDARRRLGAQGRAHVVERYDRGAIADRLGEELDSLIDPGSTDGVDSGIADVR